MFTRSVQGARGRGDRRATAAASLLLLSFVGAGVVSAACASDDDAGDEQKAGAQPDAAVPDVAPPPAAEMTAIPASPQREGDPARGYRALVNDGYISLGIPWTGFSAVMTPLEARDMIPGREGKNALVGYSFNVSTNARGIEIASPNCLSCHATHLGGKLVVGLGRPHRTLATPSGIATDVTAIALALQTSAEFAEYQEFGSRLLASQEAGTLIVFGTLAAYRDPKTLAWSSSARFDAHTGLGGWVDVPPWWRTKKKNGLYATGMGRGDHVRHTMNMTVFSVTDEAEAKALDATFVDVASYLRSIEPPKYPAAIDAARAAAGKTVFEAACATCHGTYGANASYPNLLVPAAMVGTDPELAQKSWVNQAAIDWFAGSFYGALGSRMEPSAGYVAPPLDGIWATAPFLHNGSIPTLEALLDSTKRPRTWQAAFGDDDYDLDAVGWKTGTTGGIVDTTRAGDSNAGHTYGDALGDEDRRALIEYLKTL